MAVELASLLRDAFLELLISQRQFGEMLNGMPQSTVSTYLRGERAVDVDTLVKMCQVLGIDPVEIFAAAVRSAQQ